MTDERLMIAQIVIGMVAIVLLSGCTTGGMLQVGWLPVTAIEHHQSLKQEEGQK